MTRPKRGRLPIVRTANGEKLSVPVRTLMDRRRDDYYRTLMNDYQEALSDVQSRGNVYDGAAVDARIKEKELGKELAEEVLWRYSDTPWSPEPFGGTSKDGPFSNRDVNETRKNLVEAGIHISPDSDEVTDFFRSYAISPGFERILRNQYGYALQNGVSQNLSGIRDYQKELSGVTGEGIFNLRMPVDLSFSNKRTGGMYVGIAPQSQFSLSEYGEFPYDFTLGHEFGHTVNFLKGVNKAMFDKNTKANTNKHDKKDSEKDADIKGLKYLLFKEGIYDVRENKDATVEDVKKLREKYPTMRPFKQMDDEQIVNMLNLVADSGEEKKDIANVAAIGGLVEKYGADRIRDVLYKDGGKIHIKPSHRGRLTELKERTGKTEAELYNDGNPAHKKMVVFARNSRKWHGDGGLLRRFDEGGDKGKSDYKEKLREFHVIKSDFENAIEEQNRTSSSLNRYISEYKNPNGYWYWTTEGKKLQRDRAQADSRLLGARNRLDSAKKEIGNATLDEFNNTPYDPMFFWDYVAGDENSAKKYYVERGIRESDKAQDVIDFFNSYGSSDGFNRIRENQKSWWLKRHPYRKLVPFELKTALRSTNWLQPRMAGLNNGNTVGIFDIDTYTDLSVMRSGNGHGAITVGTIESPEQPYLFALPHEIAHITNTSGFATAPGSIQAEALGQNTNTEDGHDSRPSEKHSDIEALRYMLFKEGIYDSRGKEDATADDIKKLREKYPKLRPLLQMDDEQAAWTINHVADANEKIDMSNIAARGGLMERYGKDKLLSIIEKMKQSK